MPYVGARRPIECPAEREVLPKLRELLAPDHRERHRSQLCEPHRASDALGRPRNPLRNRRSNRFRLPAAEELAFYGQGGFAGCSHRARKLAAAPESLRAWQRARREVAPGRVQTAKP